MSGTGFGPEIVAAVLMRDGNVCAMWGANPKCERKAQTANHRMNRQMGGSRYRNGMGNACAICNLCNDAIESDATLAELARARGVKLRDGDDPERTAIWLPFWGQWCQVRNEAMFLLGETDLTARPEIVDTETGEIPL